MKHLIAALVASTALTVPALAQDKIEEFRIGILGGENAQDRNQCLADYASEALGVPVKLFAPADYNGVIQGLLGGTIDLAWLGASGYAKTWLSDPEAVEPVFGFGDPNSTSGYLIPSIEIPQATGATMESGDYFGEVKFTGGHEQTIVAVNNGDVDAGVTWADGLGNWEDGYNSGALRKAVDAGLVDMNDLVEIWKSKPIPEGPIVLRKALPQEVKAKMTELMANLHEMDQDCFYGVAAGEALAFKPIDHEAYEIIIEARKGKSN
ncbi:phosphate/phosphite/phosphonate ABC transporter substrate-binding protein [Cribrihabitans sp. XS_ASV171]